MADHYVSPSGSATWAASVNIATPTSIATANANAAAGDTVYFRGGTYYVPLIPSHSGTSGAKITWQNYADEVPTINSTVFDGYYYYNILLWGRSWHVFDGINVLGNYSGADVWANRNNVMLLEIWYNSNYNEFRNMDIDGAGGGHMTIRSSPDATRPCVHNWIHHCSIHDIGVMYWGGTAVNQTIGPQIENECNNTTIEDCDFYHLGHTGLETFGYQSVYKNNFFHNEGWLTNGTGHEVTLYLPDTVPPAASADLWGHRDLAIYSFTGYHTRTNMLVEGNRVGTVGPPAENSGGENMSIAAPGNIIRFNDFFNAVNNGVLFKQGATRPDSIWGDYNAFYNNTIYKAGRYDNHLLTGLWQGCGIWGPDSSAAGYYRVGNHLINNIIEASGGAADISINLTNNTVESNFTGGEPLFVNTTVTDPYSLTQPDLSLQAGSPCLRAGRYLTLANGAGTNSTTLGVDRAMFFQDGSWGSDLARGMTLFPDWIAIGTVTNVVEIEAVDYDLNVITLASPMTWADNAPVWLYRNSDGTRVLYGSAPDMGAHPYPESAPSAYTLVMQSAAVAQAASVPELRPGADYDLEMQSAEFAFATAEDETGESSLALVQATQSPWAIRIGVEGSELTLPPPNWRVGDRPKLRMERRVHITRVELDDGSVRHHYRTNAPRSWTFEWARLSAADVLGIRNLAALNEPLHFQNRIESADWTWAVIEEFVPVPIAVTFASGTPRYRATLVLKEAL